MEAFETEEQRVESLRKWWQDNGTSVLLGAALGLLAIAGWKYYQHWTQQTGESASRAYEEVLKLSTDTSKAAEFKQKTESLVSDHKGTVYAEFGQFFLAREAVKADDLEKATAYLTQIRDNTSYDAIRHIATLRLARVLLAKGEAEKALALVQQSPESIDGFVGQYAMVRGQVLLKLNREAEAHTAFQDASNDKNMGMENPALPLYLDSTTQASLIEETK